MNIAEYSIRKKNVTMTLTALLLVAGIFSYNKMSRLEDPEFTIKQALVITSYPGASPQDVSEQVTDELERAIQQLGQLRRVESRSIRGLSIIKVIIKDKYDKKTLPQVWNELRHKVLDAQDDLPIGSATSIVIDDYSDVYGMFFAVTGKDYSYAELKEVVKFLQRELLSCKDVKKISFWGVQDEVIYIEMLRDKMAALGVSPSQIYDLLAEKNVIGNAGNVRVGREYIAINPTGEIKNFNQLGDILISKDGDRLTFLKDIAVIKRGYLDSPQNILEFNGLPAIGFAASTVLGGNAVTMGDAITARLKELKGQLPLGVEIHPISLQSETVKSAIENFVARACEAVLIVIAVLLIFMGLRSGLIIGAVLIITIAGTFPLMEFFGISLERISLGALIIALGMLVDNAIVVTEGMMVRIHKGEDKLAAAGNVVSQTKWPLLCATAISIFAFAAIGTSQDVSGEYCGSLFYVMVISLSISWIIAITLTPLLCYYSFNRKKETGKEYDPYGNLLFRVYRKSLDFTLHYRKTALLSMLILLLSSIVGFCFVGKNFFPSSTRPQFMIEMWMPSGTHIWETKKTAGEIAQFVKKQPHVTDIACFVGGGATRFILTYAPELNDSAYAILLVSVDDSKVISNLTDELQIQLEKKATDCVLNVRRFKLGPGAGGLIQVRVSGRDPQVLRQISEQVADIMKNTPNTKAIRNDWQERVKTIKPVFAEDKARRIGITYQYLCKVIKENFDGLLIGFFKENNEQLPIMARASENVHDDFKSFENISIWSGLLQSMVPVGQVVTDIKTEWEDPVVMRRNRMPTVTLHCDPKTGMAGELLKKIRPMIESIKLPPGYNIEFGGEYEDTNDAQRALFGGIPVFLIMMIMAVMCLFNSFRHTIIIWITVPLAIIGVTAGLLLTSQPFGFMALLGFLSLSGMQIRNAIVLIDEVDHQLTTGKNPYQCILDSSVSRIRPVSLGAFTVILGMIPLLYDVFFAAMAVTIMFGLAFASILTLYIVPIFYSLFFKIKPEEHTG